jgi:hypothetical protein
MRHLVTRHIQLQAITNYLVTGSERVNLQLQLCEHCNSLSGIKQF